MASIQSGMDLQNTAKEAVLALYHHPDESVRGQADRWLQDFQRTLDAWQVSDKLLHDANSNLETLIFFSQTLRSKVQRDFEELPSEAFGPLRDSLYTLLKKFYKGPTIVRTQISIAVTALAVHVTSEDWGRGGIVNWLREEMNSHPEYIPGFLEILTVLPQEAFSHKIAARSVRRHQFEKELMSSVEVALNLLTACLGFNELKEQVLEAFASWLRLNNGIPVSSLAHHPLVHMALSCLNSEQLLESSVNVVSELIQYSVSSSSGGFSAHMPLIHLLVPHIMNLKRHLRDDSMDEEDVKAVARLFSDMGDSYVELIATGSDESMLIVQALLEVASHPDYDISSMTYNFWHHLQSILTQRDSISPKESNGSMEEERNRRLLVFRSTFESLVSLVIFRVQYPINYESLNREDMKDFKHTRYASSDILKNATSVLGGEATLRILHMKLLQVAGNCKNLESCDWQSVEAIFYCIQSIAKSIPLQESEIMPQIIISLLSNFPNKPLLLQTICLTIGAYSKWLNAAPLEISNLHAVINILTRGMSMSEESAAAASIAFKYICEDCRQKLWASLDDLFKIYHIVISGKGNFKVSSDDAIHFVEALSTVITELPPDNAKQGLELLCIPIVTSLKELTNQSPSSFQQINAFQITIHIDRLACIFRFVKHPQLIADTVHMCWPVFKAIFDERPWDMRTMECLCRACKYAVRTSGKYMGTTISAMLEEVQALYKQHSQSCFLYLSSEVIKIFGSDPSCASYLQCLIISLFGHTIQLLTKIQDFTARPDIADDCFLLASRCIRYCPELFVPSPIFSPLMTCSMIGITIQHRDACKSILTFMSDVFDLANASSGNKYRSIIDSAILPRGAALTRIMIASLTGALPSSRLDEVSYVLLAFSRSHGIYFVEWAKSSISLIPSSVLTETERSSFTKALADSTSRSDASSFNSTLDELCDVCRRNRSVQEIVQEALRPHDLNLPTVSLPQ